MPDRQKVPQRQTFTKPNTTSMMRREEREPRRFLGASALSPGGRRRKKKCGGIRRLRTLRRGRRVSKPHLAPTTFPPGYHRTPPHPRQHAARAKASIWCPWPCTDLPSESNRFGLRKEGTAAHFHHFRALETRWFSQCRRRTRLGAQGLSCAVCAAPGG